MPDVLCLRGGALRFDGAFLRGGQKLGINRAVWLRLHTACPVPTHRPTSAARRPSTAQCESFNQRRRCFRRALLVSSSPPPRAAASTRDGGAFPPPHPACTITCSSFPPISARLELTPRPARGFDPAVRWTRAPSPCARSTPAGLAPLRMTRQPNARADLATRAAIFL